MVFNYNSVFKLSFTGMQCYNIVNQLYIYIYSFFLKFFSHIDHYRVLSRDPCALQ